MANTENTADALQRRNSGYLWVLDATTASVSIERTREVLRLESNEFFRVLDEKLRVTCLVAPLI